MAWVKDYSVYNETFRFMFTSPAECRMHHGAIPSPCLIAGLREPGIGSMASVWRSFT